MIISATFGVIAAGRATKDAEFKTVGDKNTHLAKFSIVGAENPVKYVNVIVWFDLADYAANIQKGDRVFVAGTLKNADYTNKDGELVKKNELVADFIQIQAQQAQTEIKTPQIPLDEDFPEIEDGDDTDLPF